MAIEPKTPAREFGLYLAGSSIFEDQAPLSLGLSAKLPTSQAIRAGVKHAAFKALLDLKRQSLNAPLRSGE